MSDRKIRGFYSTRWFPSLQKPALSSRLTTTEGAAPPSPSPFNFGAFGQDVQSPSLAINRGRRLDEYPSENGREIKANCKV